MAGSGSSTLFASRIHPDQGQTKHILTTENSSSLSWPNTKEEFSNISIN